MSLSSRRPPSMSLSRSIGHVKVRSPSLRCKPVSSHDEADQTIEFLKNNDGGSDNGFGGSNVSGNKVMVVVDARLDYKGALEWALSHTVQTQDTIVLLHVARPPKKGAEANWKKRNVRTYDMLQSMKNICQLRRPGVQIELSIIEGGNQKGSVIVEEAKQQKVSLLVLGQRKKPIFWRLIKKLFIFRNKNKNKNKEEEDFVNYCIQNSSCMTIGVRRKGSKVGGGDGGGGGASGGGYLITTKRHKKFWLLA